MNKNKKLIVVLLAAALTLLSACGNANVLRKEIQQGDSKIIVLDAKNKSVIGSTDSVSDFDIEKIDKYEGIKGEGWLSDDSLLITKENQGLEPIRIFDQMSTVRNLYSYVLGSKEEKMISKEMDYVWLAVASPDGKHVFYEKYADGMYTGQISDLDGNVTASMPENNPAFSANQAAWVDNENVIITAFNGDVSLLNINSEITKIEGIGQMQTNIAAKVDNEVYYISTDRNLIAYDINSKQGKVIKGNVFDFVLSPEKDMLALEVKKGNGGTALVLTDLEGNEKSSLTEAKSIFAVSWSPDSSKLAYLMISDDESKSGLYIMDLKSKADIFAASDFLNVDNGMKWSPSGKKILASISEVKDMKLIDKTYIISLT